MSPAAAQFAISPLTRAQILADIARAAAADVAREPNPELSGGKFVAVIRTVAALLSEKKLLTDEGNCNSPQFQAAHAAALTADSDETWSAVLSQFEQPSAEPPCEGAWDTATMTVPGVVPVAGNPKTRPQVLSEILRLASDARRQKHITAPLHSKIVDQVIKHFHERKVNNAADDCNAPILEQAYARAMARDWEDFEGVDTVLTKLEQAHKRF